MRLDWLIMVFGAGTEKNNNEIAVGCGLIGWLIAARLFWRSELPPINQASQLNLNRNRNWMVQPEIN